MPTGPLDLLNLNTVATMLDVDRKTVLAMWRRGQLPDPVDIAPPGAKRRQLRWHRCGIDAYIVARPTVKAHQVGGKSRMENKGREGKGSPKSPGLPADA